MRTWLGQSRRLSLQVCAIIAYSLGQTTLGEQIGSWGGQARFHRPPLAEELFASILGGGTKMLPAVPFRLFATVPNVEPPLGGSSRLEISSGKPFPVKVLGGVGDFFKSPP